MRSQIKNEIDTVRIGIHLGSDQFTGGRRKNDQSESFTVEISSITGEASIREIEKHSDYIRLINRWKEIQFRRTDLLPNSSSVYASYL